MTGVGILSFLPYPRRRSSPMMPIRYIEVGYAQKGFFQKGDVLAPRDCPQFMTNTVFGQKIKNRCSLEGTIDKFINAGDPAVGKEYGFGICIQALDMANTIVLLRRPGQFVLLDTPLIIFLIITAPD